MWLSKTGLAPGNSGIIGQESVEIPFRTEGQINRICDSLLLIEGLFADVTQRRWAQIMHKMKTHKGVKKRFRITASGKAKHRPAGTSHRNVRVSQKRKRNLRGTTVLDATMETKIRRALGKYSN